MFGNKDKGDEMMKQITDVLNNLTDEEKASRAKSLKKLMDNELNKRKLMSRKKPK